MLGYIPTMSTMTKIVFLGIEPKFQVFFIKSLMYDHPVCMKSFKTVGVPYFKITDRPETIRKHLRLLEGNFFFFLIGIHPMQG